MDEKEAEKKCSLRNEKLKANRTSETEEQRKERLRIRREKVVASKQLRLAVETEEERKNRLEAFLKSWQLCLSFKLDVLTTLTPTTERYIDHDLLSASLILLDIYMCVCMYLYK